MALPFESGRTKGGPATTLAQAVFILAVSIIAFVATARRGPYQILRGKDRICALLFILAIT